MKNIKENNCILKIEYVIVDEDDTTPKNYPIEIMDMPFKEIYPSKTLTQAIGLSGIARLTIYPPPDIIISPYDREKYKHTHTYLDGKFDIILPQGEIKEFSGGEHKLMHEYMLLKKIKNIQDYMSGKKSFHDAFFK